MKTLLLAFAAFLLLPLGPAAAQDAGYQPPPMFEEPVPLPPRPAASPASPPVVQPSSRELLITPKRSTYVPADIPSTSDISDGKNLIPRKISPAFEPSAKNSNVKKGNSGVFRPIPVPPRKPPAASVKTVKQAEKKAAAPAVKPSPPENKASLPASKGAVKVEHDGVVTGPKTMPAVPAQAVDEVALYAPQNERQTEQTIFERHQQEVEQQKLEAAQEKAKAEAQKQEPAVLTVPEGFEQAEQSALKKILPFKAGETVLKQEDLALLGASIKEELDKRDGWRVQIRSYASKNGDQPGNAKRISLARAINLRKSLLEQKVDPSHIDIRVEGASDDPGQVPDRVDIYLYGPAKTAENQ